MVVLLKKRRKEMQKGWERERECLTGRGHHYRNSRTTSMLSSVHWYFYVMSECERTDKRIHTHSHTLSHTHAHTHAHTRTDTHSHTHTHTHTRTHAHTHTHTHTRTQTHTHTHTVS